MASSSSSDGRGLRVAFLTVQYDHVNSGPGTFTKYIRDHEGTLRHHYTFFSDDMAAGTDRGEVPVISPKKGQLARYRAYHETFLSRHRESPFDVLWYNTSPVFGLHSARARLDIPMVQMVSDYSNAVSARPLSTVRQFGLRRSIVRSVLHRMEKQSLLHCDMAVANSRYLRQTVCNTYGLPMNRVHVLYKGVDLQRFLPKAEDGFSEPYRILFLKTDYVLGGLRELLSALADFPHGVVLTIGGPSEAESSTIRSLAERVNCQVPIDCIGRVPREAVPDLIAKNDIFCVPSHVEALGVSFLESLASGVPVIACNVGGVSEVLDGGRAGWMVNPFRPNEIRSALLQVIENEAERRTRIERGLRQVRGFSVDIMLERLEFLIDAAADAHHSVK